MNNMSVKKTMSGPIPKLTKYLPILKDEYVPVETMSFKKWTGE
jgi:hypothetical protein